MNAHNIRLLAGVAATFAAGAAYAIGGASGDANPKPAFMGDTVTIYVTVAPSVDPPSTGVVAFVDLSIFGAGALNPTDDGRNGDVSAKDGIYTGQFVMPRAAAGPYSLPFRVSDAQGRTVTGYVPIYVGALPCQSDFNGDGDVGTDADIEAFFACLSGSCCDRCGSMDFNADGDSATDADIEAFFTVLGGGPC